MEKQEVGIALGPDAVPQDCFHCAAAFVNISLLIQNKQTNKNSSVGLDCK